MMARKPISLGMTITLTMIMSEGYLKLPGAEETLKKKLSEISPSMLTPEEFEIHGDAFFKAITGEKKK